MSIAFVGVLVMRKGELSAKRSTKKANVRGREVVVVTSARKLDNLSRTNLSRKRTARQLLRARKTGRIAYGAAPIKQSASTKSAERLGGSAAQAHPRAQAITAARRSKLI